MSLVRNMNPRERIMGGVVLALLVCAGVYYGFLLDFVEDFQVVSRDLEKARQDYESLRKLLQTGPRIDRQYEAIAASLPKAEEGKKPEVAFNEEIAAMFRDMGLGRPSIDVEETPPAEVEGFSYLILPIKDIRGDLAQVTRILRSFHERGFLIRELNIESEKGRTFGLPMRVSVAQIVRTEDLSPDPGRRKR
jgi:hypothetical protein